MNVNLNCSVKVLLTYFGLSVLKDYYNSLFTDAGIYFTDDDIHYLFYNHHNLPPPDSEGYHHFQLYELMQIFGKCLYIGTSNLPFRNNEIIINDTSL